MQAQLDAEYGSLGIQLLAINPFYAVSSVGLMADGADLPLLQDVDNDGDGVHDVWTTLFSAQYRDVVIVDRDGQQVDQYNLTLHSLQDPDNFDELRERLIAYATPAASEWYNADNPVDVNNDGLVLTIDVLFVINSLNQDGARQLEPRTSGDIYYYDVSNDGYLSPIDALLVINYLTTEGNNNAEGEPESTNRLAATVADDTRCPNDAVPGLEDSDPLDACHSTRAGVIDRAFETIYSE